MFRLILTYLFLTFMIGNINAQDSIGGPYQPDSATVLLMHFDGNLQNETTRSANGEVSGKTIFTRETEHSVFGQQLFIDNDSISKTGYSHVRISDTSSLDLTGSWTIQLWFKLDSLTHRQKDIISSPHIIEKPGDPNGSKYTYSNYFVHINEPSVDLVNGYYSDKDEEWIQLESPNNLIQKERWYHLTLIRDSSSQKIVQLIHQNANDVTQLPKQERDSLKRVHYAEYNYGEKGLKGSPSTSDQPLFLGVSPQNDTTWMEFHGHIDELRISNIARYENNITSINKEDDKLPSRIRLQQNYPNPFNPSTTIRFYLSKARQINLTVYNVRGQEIETLVNERVNEGKHSIKFKAKKLPSGVYIYRLKSGDYSNLKKMLLVK